MMMVIRTLITVGLDRQWRPHRSIVAVLLSSLLGATTMSIPGALAAPRETSVLPPPSLAAPPQPQALPADLPPVLTHGDVALHHRILAAQNTGDWALADRLIGELHNPQLLGYLL